MNIHIDRGGWFIE